MGTALAATGWALAIATIAALAWAWRARGCVLEAVARARHELSGPLTAAQLALHVPPGRCGDATMARLRAVERELGRAVLTLRDLDAIPNGAPRLTPRTLEPVDLAELAADSVEAWRAFAAVRRVRLEPPRCDGGAAVVLADPARVAQATGNLIANAIEHGGGEVVISCRCVAGSVRIEVTDGGPGLPAPVAELIARPRCGRGARGRGLAIAAEVAAVHHGWLSAAPATRGARLVLELPQLAVAPGTSMQPAT